MAQDLLVVKDADKYGYIDENGTAWLNAEFVARGLGWTQTQTKADKEYTSIRWETLNRYLAEFGFPNKVGEKDFIPENMFFRLVWKSRDEKALAFQSKVADEILPTLRRTGTYSIRPKEDPRAILTPTFLRQIADRIETLENQVAELQPKADYCEKVLVSDEKLTSELIAKEYGKHAEWLNKLLSDLGVIYKRGRNYFLKAAYANRNYRVSDTVTLERGKTVVNHYWTQKGREFIYNLLKNRGTLPVRERQEPMDELF